MRAIIIALAVAALPGLVHAQGWGMSTGGSGIDRSGNASNSAHWDRCTNARRTYDTAVSIESCDRLLAESSQSRSTMGPIYWYRGMRNLDAGQHAQYEDDLKRAGEYITANPRRFDGYVNRAAVLMRLGQFDQALADYERAAALESNATAPWMGRGNVLFRRGDYAGASDAYDRAARIAARMASTGSGHHSTRCVVRAAMRDDLDRALSFCNRAVRNSDNPSGAFAARAYLHFMSGDIDAAAIDFASAVEADPYSASAIYGRGVVAVRQGRAEEGQADMARGVAMDRVDVDFYANAGLRP